MFKYLTNLLNTQVADFSVPPENAPTLPEFPNKAAYRQWSVQPTTDHVFASAYTGIVETLRVSENNIPHKVAGLIVDYDTNYRGDIIEQVVANTEPEFRPQFATRTHSNGVRLWFIFETPILFKDREKGTSKMSGRIIVESMLLVTRWGITDRARALRRRFSDR